MGAANLTSESESFDLNGNKSSSKTFTDAASKTVTNHVLVGRAELAKPDISVSRFGLMVSNTDSAGVEMKLEYDALGRKIKTVDPRTGASIIHFDSKGRVDFVADAAGNKTEFGYDETTGRKIWEKNATGKFTRYAYDVKGRMTKTWGDSVYPVAYSYDDTGRMISMTTYRSGAGWNGETFPENATGDTTKWHYDPSTASLNKIDYSDETADIVFAYDRLGRQKSITDAVGTRTFAYNDSLQLQSEKIEGLTQATITRLYETDGVKGRSSGFIVSSAASKSKKPQTSPDGNSSSLPLPLGEGWGERKNAEGKSGSLEYQISYGYDPSGRIRTLSWNAGGKAVSLANIHPRLICAKNAQINTGFIQNFR